MTNALYWLLAILVFGLLIFIHELGHYLTARLFRVRIREFSIGMGPKMVTYTSKKTDIKYSIGVLPFGGYVSMAGEDEESDDPDSFEKKAAWKRFIVIAAGALMNLLLGVVLVLGLVISSGPLATNRIGAYPADSFFEENELVSSAAYGLLPGDEIVAINGTPVHIAADLAYEIQRQGGEGPVIVSLYRDGRLLDLSVTFPTQTASGIAFGMMDFYVQGEEQSLGGVLYHTFYRTTCTVRMIWDSLVDLVRGRYGFEAVSGPVGVAGAITDAAATDWRQFVYLVAVISVNLGVVNLLPLPALDGGRLVFLLIEMIARRPVPQKYEAAVHFVGIILLFGLMIAVTFKDIFSFFV